MTSHPEEEPVARAASALEARFGAAPAIAIVLGSGLSSVLKSVAVEATAPYSDLCLPEPTIEGHEGRAVVGKLGEKRVIVLSGRVHVYEGLGAQVVVRATRALHRWGVRNLILTNSAGGLSPEHVPGDLVLVTDHINLQGTSPLLGPPFGTRFPDMTYAYHPILVDALRDGAERAGVYVHEGVYAAMSGPAYETPAEVRMLQSLGADLAGMSTVPEVLAANALGMRVAAIALVSNLGAGLTDATLSHGEVTSAGEEAGSSLARLLEAALGFL